MNDLFGHFDIVGSDFHARLDVDTHKPRIQAIQDLFSLPRREIESNPVLVMKINAKLSKMQPVGARHLDRD